MKQVTIKHRNISIIFLMLFFFSSVHAQQFVNATLDGAQSVCAITQDKQGMMWLGTDNGLYSYDGYYSYRHYQDHSFSNTRVNALAFKGNMLYLATGNGVLKFDTQKYGYASTPARANFENASKKKQIKEQRVLDLTQEKGLFGSDVYALLAPVDVNRVSVVAVAVEVIDEKFGAALTDNDASGGNFLTAVDLHAAILRIAVATVTAGRLTLLMCHG